MMCNLIRNFNNMKTTKYILFIVLLSVSTLAWAVEYNVYQTSSASYRSSSMTSNENGTIATSYGSISTTAPTMQFQSTSTMSGSGSTLSSTTNAIIESNEPNAQSNNGFSGPRKARPEDNDDPYDDPITDAVPCLLFLAAAYCLYLRRKNRIPTPDTRHNQ